MAALTSEQIKLFEALHDSRTEDFKTFNKESYRGVWGGIIDKYPETAHFIYELLQNADDAGATEAQITLFRDKLYFKHNGTKHFNVTKEDAEEVWRLQFYYWNRRQCQDDILNNVKRRHLFKDYFVPLLKKWKSREQKTLLTQ